MSELSFEQMLEESLKTIRTGEIVTGKVIDVKEDEIVLNIGYKSDGIIPRSEYTNEANVDLRTDVYKRQTQYVDENGNATMEEFWNPNGSYMAIEGITSPDGRILGKMAHSERRGEAVAMNIYGEQDMKIFESGVKYFK